MNTTTTYRIVEEPVYPGGGYLVDHDGNDEHWPYLDDVFRRAHRDVESRSVTDAVVIYNDGWGLVARLYYMGNNGRVEWIDEPE